MSKSENLIVNNLVYAVPPSSTACIERSYKRGYFDNRKYTKERTMRAVIQTGAQYVNTLTSSLVIKLKNKTAPGNVSWGAGSAYNLIKNIRVFSKSGVELSNVLNANLNRVVEDKLTENQDWFNTQGGIMGYQVAEGGYQKQIGATDEISEWHIPMCKVAPVFNPLGEQLCPAALLAGAVIEIDLESPDIAFVCGDVGAVADYEIDDIYFNLDCSTLNDMTIMTMNDITAKQLLEWTYVDIYNSKVVQGSNNETLSTSINKSVSFADHITALIQNQARTTNKNQDAFILLDSEQEGSYQFTLGSVQLPSNVPVQSLEEQYYQLLSTYNKLRPQSGGAGRVRYPDFLNTLAVKSTSFSKDQMLSLSQLPISSSRSLRLEANLVGSVEPRVCNIYLHYLKVVEVSLTDTKVNY